MYFLPFRLFSHHVCVRRRSRVAPSGWVFLRNYKRSHRGRIQQSIEQAALASHIWVAEQAFDESGLLLTEKIAVYGESQESASLFFQIYAQTKAGEKRDAQRKLSLGVRQVTA